MKVYGTNDFRNGRQVRVIFAGTKKQFAEALNCSMYQMALYTSSTGNKRELEIALSKPLTLFTQELDNQDGVYTEWHPCMR